MKHNEYLYNLQELQELQSNYSIKYNYLTTINKTIENIYDVRYYEKHIYKVDIYSNCNNEIILLGYKELYYDCLDKDKCDLIVYVVNAKYKINELKNSFDNFYLYVYYFLKNKKFI